MSSDQPALLTITGLHTRTGGRRVLRGLDLYLPPGHLHAVVGPSGVGKSTLLRALTGTLPTGTEIAGSARLVTAATTVDLLSGDPHTLTGIRGSLIGYLPQNAAASFTPVRTLGAHLSEILRGPHRRRLLPGHPHLSAASTGEHINHLAQTVGMDPGLLDRYPHEVSGGQIRRAALAAALAWHPPLLLADEPTRGLDQGAAVLLGQMLRTTADAGHSVLLVTHEHDLARQFADTVTRLDPHDPPTTGSPHDVLPPPRHRQPAQACPVTDRAGGGLVMANITAGYPGRPVLDGIDLTVHPGQVHGIAGPTGIGKSTLAAVATGLHTPDRGQVLVDGDPLARLRGRARRAARARVAWMHQEPAQAFDPRLPLHRCLTLPAQVHRRPVPDLDHLAQTVGLHPGLLDRYPHEVSGGELQRAALARALTLDPRYLVCDEITAMLDPDSTHALMGALRRLTNAGMGVLLVSHDATVLDGYADTVTTLTSRGGGVVAVRPSSP